MTKELKPCPFCGGEAVFAPEGLVSGGYWIRCRDCNIEQPIVYLMSQDAIDAWNRRVQP